MFAGIISRKKIEDVVVNIGAYALPIAASNLIILPLLAAQFTPADYGLIAAATSLINLVPRTLGKTLNNIRLINDKKYSDNNIDKGDFSTLLFAGQAISLVVVLALLIFYIGLSDSVDITLVALMGALWFFREYYCVTFRIQINFKRIFLSNLTLVAGYALGGLLYVIFARWQLIYVAGQLASCLYIVCHTKMHTERPSFSPRFIQTCKDYVSLSCSELLANIPLQFDKLILLPILGGVAISTYYAASVVTKILSLVITPFNSVVLSYISKKDRLTRRTLLQVVFIGVAVSVLCCLLNYLLGDWILSVLYPSYRADAIVYVPLTALSAALVLFWSVIQPFAMMYGSLTWMMLVNGISSALFLGIAFLLAADYGIWAICIGAVVSNLFKALAFVFMCINAIKVR